jgi:hypothetical protein
LSGGIEEVLGIGEGLVVVGIFGNPDGFVESVLVVNMKNGGKWGREDLRPSDLTQMGC